MSNYTKTTNFATKDSLPSGNANKIVKGTEIDTEFNNIATAVATKADTAGPTFTGTVTIPTADINGGAVDGTTIGAASASSIVGTTIVANTSINIAGDGATVTGIKDEDDMSSNSATKLATQQSIKAYVDSQLTAQDLDVTDGSSSIDIDLDSESLGILGGTGIDSTASGTGVTLAIDSTVATLTGSQTLTNKTLTAPTLTGTAVVASLDISGDVDVDGTLETDALSINSTTVTSTAAELNILDGVTATASELNILDGVTSTTAELNILDGVTSTAAELNILDGVTSTTAELNILDGVTSTTAELNILDGVTATASELNIMDGVTASTAELNIMDGVTSTTAELNILDGVTSTAAELNILDGKAFLDEDDMSSNSATGIASQQSIKAYVDAQITAEDLDFQADSGGALSIDLDSETLTFTGGTGIDTSGSGNAVTFAIDSTVATLTGSQTLTNKSLTAPTLTGTAVVASLDISGDIDVDGTTNLDVVDIDGAVDMASTLSVGGNITQTTGDFLYSGGINWDIKHTGAGQNIVFSTTPSGGSTTEVLRITSDGDLAKLSGSLTIDVGGNIKLDADDNGEVRFLDGGTQFATIKKDGDNMLLQSIVADGDLLIQGIDGSSFVTAMTFDMSEGGNVGIGAAPNTTGFGGTFRYLGVNGGTGLGTFNGQTSSTTANQEAAAFFGSTTGTSGSMPLLGGMQVINDASSASNGEGAVRFYTASGGSITEKMRIKPDGKVGIGQSVPVAHVHIKTGTNTPLLLESTSGGGGYVEYRLGASGAVLGYLGSAGELISGGSSSDLGIRSQGAINLATNGNNSRMTIADSGITMELAQSAGNADLRYNTGTEAVTYDTSSERFKENIRDNTSYGLTAVNALQSRMFEYKDDGRTDVGLIAEEVVEVVPELVGLDNEGNPLTVDYKRFVSVLVKAVQEQQTLIESLTDRIAALEQ